MTRDDFFQKLFQRPPTQEEQHRFDRFQDVMSLATDDSMWYVILVNEFYVYFGSRSPPARRNRSTVTAKEVHCHGEEVQFV